MQQVSIVATVLNEVEEIGRLVPSLLGQIPPPAEVVIVDGGSTDGTWERLLDEARRNPNLVPIRDESCNLKRSPGPISRGRNVAIAAALSHRRRYRRRHQSRRRRRLGAARPRAKQAGDRNPVSTGLIGGIRAA